MTAKAFVVDACVARSAGDKIHPVSTHCRGLLSTILESGHQIRLAPELRKEWDDHMSRFARTWLKQMMARRLVLSNPAPCPDDIEPAVRRRVTQPQTLIEVLKDLHLVCAAIRSDQIIISCDDKARRHLAGPARDISAIGDIMWDNPCEEPAHTVAWIKSGATLDHSRRLANYSPI